MSLKKFLISLGVFVTIGMALIIYYPAYLMEVMGLLVLLAVAAEIGRLISHFRKTSETSSVSPHSNHDKDGEYHNDFSKVPAGIDDPSQPRLKPRGIIMGDPYRAFEENLKEDLARIGLTDDKDKKLE